MNRSRMLRWALLGASGVAALAAALLFNGVLIGSRIDVYSSRDEQAAKITNTSVLVCRYLHVFGVAERALTVDDEAPPVCSRFGSL